jgi:hypothetical protein
MAVILFLGGLQLMALGIMGEYLGRLYMESKARPLYLIDQWHPRRAADELRVPVVHSPGNTTVRRG